MFVQQTAHLRVFSCTTGTLDWKHLNSYLRASLSERERPSCKKTFFSRIHTFIPLNISYGNSLYKDTYKRKNESRHEMYMLTMNSDTCWCFVLVTKNTSSCISFSLFTVPMAFPVLTIYIALYIFLCLYHHIIRKQSISTPSQVQEHLFLYKKRLATSHIVLYAVSQCT